MEHKPRKDAATGWEPDAMAERLDRLLRVLPAVSPGGPGEMLQALCVAVGVLIAGECAGGEIGSDELVELTIKEIRTAVTFFQSDPDALRSMFVPILEGMEEAIAMGVQIEGAP